MAAYPQITGTRFGEITVGGQTYEHDVYVLADGRVKKRKKKLAKRAYGTSHKIGPDELAKVCEGDPQAVFLGTGQYGVAELTDDGERFLRDRDVAWRAMPTPQAIRAYNDCSAAKAALLHVTC